MNRHYFTPFLVLYILFFSIYLCSPATYASEKQADATSQYCISSGWPQDSSDIQPHPDITFGRFENGLRYLLLKNNGPANRVDLFLTVQAGSLQETDEQLGYAHYLEHMMFNGTTHYPPGTLVDFFQSIGMKFGPEVNALTYPDKTIYSLELPSVEKATLENGIVVLADYARGALLLEEEVERERGVILSEMRSRDSAKARIDKKLFAFAYNGTKAAERLPMGTQESVAGANGERLRAYYESWYRPENMVVVVVGGMVKKTVVDLLKKHMASIEGGAAPPPCIDFGKVAPDGTRILYTKEPELGHTEITLGTLQNVLPRTINRLEWQKLYTANLGVRMMLNRLQSLAREPSNSFIKVGVESGFLLQRVRYNLLIAKTKEENWKQGLELLHNSLRQVLTHGFTEGELIVAKKQYRAFFRKNANTILGNHELAYAFIDTISNNEVPMSPQQALEEYETLEGQLTLEQVNAAFKNLWAPQLRLIAVAGTADLEGQSSSAEEIIAEVYAMEDKKDLVPWKPKKEHTFPYLDEPEERGEVREWKYNEPLDIHSYTLTNGTKVNIKNASRFLKNEVHLDFQFGLGKITESKPGLAMLAERVVRESGFGQMDREQLRIALAGTSVEGAFSILNESFALRGQGSANELELLLQLAYAQLHDPAFSQKAFARSWQQINQWYDQMEHTINGVQLLKGDSFLAKGNKLYGVVARNNFNALQLSDVEQWLRPAFAEAPFEINLVGDIDADEALKLILNYFGTRKLSKERPLTVGKTLFPQGQTLKLTAQTAIDKSLLTVAWKTHDARDVGRTRRLDVLAAVFEDRLRKKIREELGATYTPEVYNRSSEVYEGFGMMRCVLTIDPQQAEMLTEVIKDIAVDLAMRGVREDEFLRAHEPFLAHAQEMKRGSGYWLRSVMYLSSRHLEQFAWAENKLIDIASITEEELGILAKEYLQSDAAAVVIVGPE